MSTPRVHVYKSFERFWHWTQAILILFLALTGFEVHGSYQFLGYRQAVLYHSTAAVAFLALIAFAIFWHFTTGEWRQYVPSRRMLRSQLNYYLVGIFRNEPHPTKKTPLSKLNPLQKLVYLALKILVIPIMMLSGLLYMFFRYPQANGIGRLADGHLERIALVHSAGAFFLVAFVIAHAYLISTGKTPVSNLKAMITGYEEFEDTGEEAVETVPAAMEHA